MHEYQVQLSADFVVRKGNPGQIKDSLIRIIKREGFEEKNFIISIDRIGKELVGTISSVGGEVEKAGKEVIKKNGKQKVTKIKEHSKDRKGNNHKLQRGGKGSHNIHIQSKVAKKVRKAKR